MDDEELPLFNDARRIDPLHRTRKTSHTQHEGQRRDLERFDEIAFFDAEGFLAHFEDRQELVLDCDCTSSKGMAGQCGFCNPPKRLCSEHLFHCAKCGRGSCKEHAKDVIVKGPTLCYCPKCAWKVTLQQYVYAVFAPLFDTDGNP